jgi:predicted RNA-binding protein Jag
MFEVFKLDKSEYNTNIDPVKHYIDQAALYVSKQLNLPEDKAKDYVKNVLNDLKRNNKIVNPKVRYRERTIDGEIKDNQITTLLGYINYVKQNNEILVPSFTVYFNPNKKKSLHAEFISVNIEKRSKHRHCHCYIT